MSPTKKPTSGKRGKAASAPMVQIILGSRSDLPVVEGTGPLLDRFGISWDIEIASAHRQPDKLKRIVRRTEAAGTRIYIGVAGMAAHLPGVLASLTARPVIGVPVAGSSAGGVAGLDALLSIVQMPPGVPVATVAIGPAGARNAAVLAARILALSDDRIAREMDAYRRELARGA